MCECHSALLPSGPFEGRVIKRKDLALTLACNAPRVRRT